MNITRNTYLTTEAAAARIDQQLKDWVVGHSPKREQAAARRELSNAKTGGNFQSQRLSVMSSRLQRSPFRRCNSYYITHRNREETGYTYLAGIHIFTIEENLLSGVIGHVYASDQEPPDNMEWDVAERIETFKQIFLNADQERYRAMERGEFTTDKGGRELPIMPGVYIMVEQPDGEDKAHEAKIAQLQEAAPRAKVVPISERGIINAAREMKDDQLRPWLSAAYRMVAIKESGERRFTYPQEEELAAASEAEAQAMDDHNSAQAICAMIRNMLILSTMSQAEIGARLNQQQDEVARQLLSETGGQLNANLSSLQLALLAKGHEDGPTAEDVAEIELEWRRNGAGHEATGQNPDPANDEIREENERLRIELADSREQVANLQEALRYSGQQPAAEPAEEDSEDEGGNGSQRTSRADLVLEAITDPARFPRLRFLAPAQEVASYGKARPQGEEIIAALDAINRLADQYYEKEGKVGNWADHFQLPGWTYSPRDSQTTMGKHQDERTFTDHETGNRVVIDRHMTYPTGRYGGMQIYFDQDDATSKFIVAYIGSHKTAAHERS